MTSLTLYYQRPNPVKLAFLQPLKDIADLDSVKARIAALSAMRPGATPKEISDLIRKIDISGLSKADLSVVAQYEKDYSLLVKH